MMCGLALALTIYIFNFSNVIKRITLITTRFFSYDQFCANVRFALILFNFQKNLKQILYSKYTKSCKIYGSIPTKLFYKQIRNNKTL